MIEPGDVVVSTWEADSCPFPALEPYRFEGPPKFLDRSASDAIRFYVGDWYEFSIRMKGERPIAIKFEQEKMYGRSGQWTMIKSFQLVNDQTGFTVKFPLKNRNAGKLHLRYIASNSKPGAVIKEQTLLVQHKQKETPGG